MVSRRSICHQTEAASLNNKHTEYKRVNEVSVAEYHKLQLTNGDLQGNLHAIGFHPFVTAKSIPRASRPVTDTVLT